MCSAPLIVEITPRSPAELPASLGVRGDLRAENIAWPARAHEAGHPAKFIEVLDFAFLAGQTRSTVSYAA